MLPWLVFYIKIDLICFVAIGALAATHPLLTVWSRHYFHVVPTSIIVGLLSKTNQLPLPISPTKKLLDDSSSKRVPRRGRLDEGPSTRAPRRGLLDELDIFHRKDVGQFYFSSLARFSIVQIHFSFNHCLCMFFSGATACTRRCA